MRSELEQKLVERWPSLFNVNGSTYETRMVDGFAHGDGWFEIVWRLCEDLEPLVAEAEKATGRPFEVLQVKTKIRQSEVLRQPWASDGRHPATHRSLRTGVSPHLRGVREAREGAGRLHSDGVR